jgi:hypothetical protein
MHHELVEGEDGRQWLLEYTDEDDRWAQIQALVEYYRMSE